MKPTRLRPLSILPLLCLLALSPQGGATDPDQAKAAARLEAVQTEIEALQKKLESARGQRGKLQAELRRIEREIGRAARELRRIDAKLTKQKKRLTQLHADRADQLDDLAAQRASLGRQIRAAYAMGRQEQLKLLLNQQEPALVGRTLVYYDYFNRARAARIGAVEETLKDLRRIEAEIAEQSQALEKSRALQTQRKRALESGRKERKQVLGALNKEIRSKGRELEELRENERELQSLLASLNRALKDIPPLPPEEHTPFGRLQGRLPWPTDGPLKARFGTQRGQGKLTWRGVLIGAPEGRRVKAVSHGRVAFADWMRGFGLLIILDHGDGYMSLYGHNQSLFKSTGDWVAPGEVIASTGDSGGQMASGLYFEIRHKGKPLDPAAWCNANARLAAQPH